jgi:zinc protease
MSLKRLRLKDLRAWVEGPLKKGPLELSVVGDIDVDEVIGLAARYFGSLPARGPAEAAGTRPQPQAPRDRSLRLEAPTRIPKALVVLAYPTEGFWDIRRTRRLSMLAEVISDRMRVVLREKLGLAYSPLAYNRPSRAYPDYGLLVAMVHTAPADTDRVAEAVRQIVADLAKGGVTEDENTRALKPMLTAIREQVEQNEYWLESVLTGVQEHPEQLDWSRTMLKDYTSITPGELSALAKKYLDNAQSATIILQPAGQEKTP